MRKGQLVKRVKLSGVSIPDRGPLFEQWRSPCIVLKGPYERQSPSTAHSGRVYHTELILCIDVLYEGEPITGLRADDFVRVKSSYRH